MTYMIYKLVKLDIILSNIEVSYVSVTPFFRPQRLIDQAHWVDLNALTLCLDVGVHKNVCQKMWGQNDLDDPSGSTRYF